MSESEREVEPGLERERERECERDFVGSLEERVSKGGFMRCVSERVALLTFVGRARKLGADLNFACKVEGRYILPGIFERRNID